MGLIGVPINTSKSVISADRPVVEFAKRTWYKTEFSPFSFKQFMSAIGFRGRISNILAILKKELSVTSKVKPMFIANTILKSKP